MNVYDGLNVFLFLIGIYLLIQAVAMYRQGKVPSALIAKEEQGKVKDEAAIAAEIRFSLLLLALVMICDGILGELFARVYPISWFRYVQMGLFLASWMYFMKKYQDAKAVHIAV